MPGEVRPGEVAVPLPPSADAELYFIGLIRTPWRTRSECPRQGSADGPVCSVIVDERWRLALNGLAGLPHIQVLYWMDQARRDLVLQMPRGADAPVGTFALRSPARPNPVASSIVAVEGIEGMVIRVRGLDCVDGTPLLDLKPHRAGG